MKGFSLAVVTALICLGSSPVLSTAPMEVVGLFKNRAVVRLASEEMLLKVGETKNGVTLVASDANEAHLIYRYKDYRLSISNRVGSLYQDAEKAQVVVASDQHGQFRIRGAVNNNYTNFLVDTGASVVAVSSKDAVRMGIDYSNGEKGVVYTAQGTTDSYFVILDEVVVGAIKAYNVRAAVIEGEYPIEPLLGMSFLRQVRMEESRGVLTLTQQD
ncbi:MAG: TIGR02281 family clan AA aspartic protease [Pseudomonadales bacterium]|jgi:aspartyl protease family protein